MIFRKYHIHQTSLILSPSPYIPLVSAVFAAVSRLQDSCSQGLAVLVVVAAGPPAPPPGLLSVLQPVTAWPTPHYNMPQK